MVGVFGVRKGRLMSKLDENKAVARAFIGAMSRLDTDVCLAMLSEDVKFETPGSSPISGVKTKAQVAKEFPALREVLPGGIEFTILSVTAEEDRVHMELAGKSKTADGKDYNNRYHYAFVIRNGQIVGFRDYLDHDLVMRILVPTLQKLGALREDREREVQRKV
jgi:ketosteroid isomerase-like protein